MQDMISMAIELHMGAIFLILAIIAWVLIVLKSDREFAPLSRKYEAVSLYYRAVLGVLFFTGLVVMAVVQFQVSWMVYVMVLVILHMIATSVKENIIYKKTHIKDIPSQEAFKKYAVKKYVMDVIMIVVVGVVSYMLAL